MSQKNSPRRLVLTLIGVALLEILGVWLFAMRPAHAEGFVLTKPSCYPLLTALTAGAVKDRGVIDARLLMHADTDVGLWWCEEPTGMQENYRTGNFGRPCEECFRVDIDVDHLWEMDRAGTRRAATDAEMVQVLKAEALYEPRCVVPGTAKTTQVLSAVDRIIGAAIAQRYPTTQRPSCYDWIRVASKLYCSVASQLDTKGAAIAAGYVACKVTTAPAQGWL